jgi:hypothetical protein
VPSNKPFIGDGERENDLSASCEAMTIVKISCVVAAILAISAAALRGLL